MTPTNMLQSGLTLAVLATLLVTASSCTNIAQLAFGEALRDDLIVDCCACLFDNSSRDSRATCSEAALVNGEFVFADDAVFGDEADIPCLCSGDDESCVDDLRNKTPIVIPGACVDALNGAAPCESACGGVLSFSPVPGG